MSETTQNQPGHESKASNFISAALKIVAYPAAAVVGYFAGDVSVRGSVYRNFAKRGYFGGGQRSSGGVQGASDRHFAEAVRRSYEERILEATEAGRERLVKNAVRFHVIKPEEMSAVLHKAEVSSAELSKLSDIAAAAVKHTVDFEGASQAGMATKSRIAKVIHNYRHEIREFFEDLGMHNLVDYAKATTRNQKWEAIIFAVTPAAVTLGALLTAANSKGLLDMLSARDKDKTKTSPAF